RFWENPPLQRNWMTLTPAFCAIAAVASVLPESTTTTSANPSSAARHDGRDCSSSFTGMTAVTGMRPVSADEADQAKSRNIHRCQSYFRATAIIDMESG